MIMKKYLLILLLVLSPLSLFGQGIRDIKINEVLVKNVDSYADDFGHKVGWIEIFNSDFASVNVGGAYLQLISGGDTTRYLIPNNDTRTNIPAQGYVVFFADGSSNKGTFHTNFKLGARGTGIEKIEFIDQSGNNVVDALEYDVSEQVPDRPYGGILNHKTQEIEYKILNSVTPLQTNNEIVLVKKSEIFRRSDPDGFAMTITAMSVVFSALIMLYLIYKSLGVLMQRMVARKEKKSAQCSVSQPVESTISCADGEELTGEKIAAIAIAINLFDEDLHDIESNVITINKVARAYSPWSSKFYSMRQLPNKK